MNNTIKRSKRLKPFRLLSAFLVLPLFNQGALADDSEHQLNVTVLENHEQGECHYSGNVVLDVRYSLNQAEEGELIIEQSLDGNSYYPIQNHDLDGRRGTLTVEVDAGDCSKDLRLSLQAF